MVGDKSMVNRYPDGEPRLDRERTAEELSRFLELAVRELNLAVEYQISCPDDAEANKMLSRPRRQPWTLNA